MFKVELFVVDIGNNLIHHLQLKTKLQTSPIF